jgi:hypothetical protein
MWVGLSTMRVTELWMPPRVPVISEPGVDDLFLRVVHHHHAGVDALADHRARRDGAVDVEQLDPVVVDDAGTAWRRPRSARPPGRRGSA